MKISAKWAALGVVGLLVVLGTTRFLTTRQTANEALAAQQAAQKVQATLQLAPADVVSAQVLDLAQVLEISGPLKAANSAFVKARVAGELQGLSLREGDFVKAGTIVARVDAADSLARLKQAQQQAESARAQVDIARRSFENNQSLVTQGFISKTALDSSIATLASSEATYRAALAGADVAQKSLEDTVLRAPISGYVAQRLAQTGERVAVDAKVIEIVDLSHLELEASLSASDSLSVRVGQTAALTIEGAAQPVTGKVVRINPSAVAGSRAVLAYLAVGGDGGLRQGLFAQGTLATGTSRVLAVPLDAVRTDKPQPYVQALVDGRIVHRTVVPGRKGSDSARAMVEVSGIEAGIQLLAGAVGALREGTPVKLTAGTP